MIYKSHYFKTIIFFSILLILDFIFITGIHHLASVIRENINHGLPEFRRYTFDKFFWINLLVLLVFTYEKIYFQRFDFWKELQKVLVSLLYAYVIVMTMLSLSKMINEYSRTYITLFFLLIAILFPLYRKYIKPLLFKISYFRKDIVIVCDNEGINGIEQWHTPGNYYGFEVKEVIIVDKANINEKLEYLQNEAKEKEYYACVVSLNTLPNTKLFYIIDHIQHHISKVFVTPNKKLQVPLYNAEIFNTLDAKGATLFIKNNLLNRFDRFIKSLFDYFVSFLLIFFSFPFLLLLWIVVFVSSGGKPLFKHRRIGQDGRSFNVYKFRTMKKDADKILQELLKNNPKIKKEWEKEFKLKNDPRITKVGSFLRKTSLDELPQIINVLQGKMSLVGPRPIVKEEIKKYGDYFDYFSAVKPGITGLWQVSGRNDISYKDRVAIDVWYTRNWSIGLDILILIKTFSVVLLKKGSY